MSDRTVRRRRGALALLVLLSLILLTAYFGQSAGGPLRSVQRGVVEVFSPIQDGASRVLKPARDLLGWFSDTLGAKEERDRLEGEVESLRRDAAAAQQAQLENQSLRRQVGLDERAGISAYRPVTARVTFRSPIVWSATIQIARGRNDGVRVDQPVINGDGLVGKVTDATAHAAQVTLITDESSGVSAQVNVPRRGGPPRVAPGVVQPAVGKPEDLLLEDLTEPRGVRVGQTVVTSGTRSQRLESLFPPGIPIGRVSRVNRQELGQFQRVHVRPFADFRRLNFVQVLTEPNGGRPSGPRAEVP